jgi:hypothetical protein
MPYTDYQIKQLGLQGKLTPEILNSYNASKKTVSSDSSGYRLDANGNRVDSLGNPIVATTDAQNLVNQNSGMYGGNTTDYGTTLNTSGQPVNNNTPTTPTTASTGNMYDVQNTNYSTGAGKYNSLNQLGVENSAVIDPYTRGLINAGVQKGQMYDIVTNQGYNNELSNRVGVMQGAAEGSAAANLGIALTDVEKQMQKAGKYASSATSRKMMGTGEVYAANLANTIAQGTLTIYDQLDTARNNELNRIATSGNVQTQAETDRWNTYVGATLENEKLRVSDETNRAIADMQANLSEQVAMIDANTTLTGYEKDIQKQAAQNKFTQSENVLNREHELKLADIDFKKSQYAVDVGASSAQTVAAIYTKSNEIITGLNLDQADQELVQELYKFNVTEVGADGKPKWQTLFDQSKIDTADQLELAKDKMAQDMLQFNISTKEGRSQFEANLTWMKDKFATESAYNTWKDGMTYEIASQQLQDVDLDREEGRTEFFENLSYMKETASKDFDIRQATLDLSAEVSRKQLKQTDWQNVESRRQFNDNMEYLKSKDAMSNTLARDLQSEALTAQRQQFDITQTDNMYQWGRQFGETVREWNLSNEQMYGKDGIVTQQLELAKTELKGNQEAQELGNILNIFKDPAVQSFMTNSSPELSATFVEDLLVGAADGNWDMTDLQSMIGLTTGDTMTEEQYNAKYPLPANPTALQTNAAKNNYQGYVAMRQKLSGYKVKATTASDYGIGDNTDTSTFVPGG